MFLDITQLIKSQLYVITYNDNFNLKFMQTKTVMNRHP